MVRDIDRTLARTLTSHLAEERVMHEFGMTIRHARL